MKFKGQLEKTQSVAFRGFNSSGLKEEKQGVPKDTPRIWCPKERGHSPGMQSKGVEPADHRALAPPWQSHLHALWYQGSSPSSCGKPEGQELQKSHSQRQLWSAPLEKLAFKNLAHSFPIVCGSFHTTAAQLNYKPSLTHTVATHL